MMPPVRSDSLMSDAIVQILKGLLQRPADVQAVAGQPVIRGLVALVWMGRGYLPWKLASTGQVHASKSDHVVMTLLCSTTPMGVMRKRLAALTAQPTRPPTPLLLPLLTSFAAP